MGRMLHREGNVELTGIESSGYCMIQIKLCREDGVVICNRFYLGSDVP